MYREVEYRGKTALLRENKWVEGNLIHGVGQKEGKLYILPRMKYLPSDCHSLDGYEVVNDSVGEFTGFIVEKFKKDLSPKVYIGDVFRLPNQINETGPEVYYVVMWIRQVGAYYLVPIEHYHVLLDNDVSKESDFDWLFEEGELRDFCRNLTIGTKVGNVFDSTEYFGIDE